MRMSSWRRRDVCAIGMVRFLLESVLPLLLSVDMAVVVHIRFGHVGKMGDVKLGGCEEKLPNTQTFLAVVSEQKTCSRSATWWRWKCGVDLFAGCAVGETKVVPCLKVIDNSHLQTKRVSDQLAVSSLQLLELYIPSHVLMFA